MDVNLRNSNHAPERYQEIINLVLYGKSYLNYFTEKEYIEDTISLNGKDWTFSQHKEVDTIPVHDDFKKTVEDFLSWKVSEALKKGDIDD